MNSDHTERPTGTGKFWGKIPSGTILLSGFAILLLTTILSSWKHATKIPLNIVIALICLAFAWLLIVRWQIRRTCSKLGFDRSMYLSFIWRPRPSDPLGIFLL